jgi:hypothetical protein
MRKFTYNDGIRVQATLKDMDTGALVDPTTVKFDFKNKSGITSYVYGVDAELVRASEGVYYVLLQLNKTGNWGWRLYGTNPVFALEGEFLVKVSVV